LAWGGGTALNESPDEKGQEVTPRRDWWQLLIIPVTLAVLGSIWGVAQWAIDSQREDGRIAADRAAAEEAREDATLQTYLDEMSVLMLEKKLLSAKKGKQGDAVRAVARTFTIVTLRRLDGGRNADVMRFLSEAGLLDTRQGINLLFGADLRGVDLGVANFLAIDLRGVNLRGADLRGAALRFANLRGTDLRGANLRGADLGAANLRTANLTGANVTRAYLGDADITGANLTDADLRAAYLGAANLAGANLMGADLGDANLRGANLRHAYLRRANFKGANLEGAILTGAALTEAENLDLAAYIAALPSSSRKEFLDSQKVFLDALSADELTGFKLSPERLANFRERAGS
jgi:uncharacterized protein YjbI with pentapeptide repeats